MRQRLRSKLTYANVMATIAVFLVLGGGTALGAYVVSSNSQIGPGTVSGHKPPTGKHANIIAGSINGQDVANGAVGPTKFGALPKVRVLQPDKEDNSFPTTTCQHVVSVPNGSEVPLQFISEEYDPLNMHEDYADGPALCGPNKSKLTAPRDGVYAISAGMIWSGSSTAGSRQLIIKRNGADSLAAQQSAASPTTATIQNVSTLAHLNQGDYVQAVAWQDSGSSLNLFALTDPRNFFAMSWIGP
jgi:hypothetical protein